MGNPRKMDLQEFRLSDPMPMRFFRCDMRVDPLAELYQEWTPYHYVLNNPLINIGQTGEFVVKADRVTRVTRERALGVQFLRFVPVASEGVLFGTAGRGDPSFQNSRADIAFGGFGAIVRGSRALLTGIKGLTKSEISLLNISGELFDTGLSNLVGGIMTVVDDALIDDRNSLVKDELIFNAATRLRTPGGNRLGRLNKAGDVFSTTGAAQSELKGRLETTLQTSFGRLDQIVREFINDNGGPDENKSKRFTKDFK